jgi:hypothetical protein
LRPPDATGGLFAALQTEAGKKLGFTAIRAMLRLCILAKLMRNNVIPCGMAEFCGFSRVNMI